MNDGDDDALARRKALLWVHSPSVQFSVASLFPSHIFPRCLGVGELHPRLRCFSHWLLHTVHSLHSSQPPSTAARGQVHVRTERLTDTLHVSANTEERANRETKTKSFHRWRCTGGSQVQRQAKETQHYTLILQKYFNLYINFMSMSLKKRPKNLFMQEDCFTLALLLIFFMLCVQCYNIIAL